MRTAAAKPIIFLLLLLAVSPAVAQTTEEDKTVYDRVDESPDFPGGMDSLKIYLDTHVKNPVKPKKYMTAKKVFVKCVVNRDGSLGEIRILVGINSLYNKEALRVVTGMPKWKPAMLGGKAVRAKWVVPIEFLVDMRKLD